MGSIAICSSTSTTDVTATAATVVSVTVTSTERDAHLAPSNNTSGSSHRDHTSAHRHWRCSLQSGCDRRQNTTSRHWQRECKCQWCLCTVRAIHAVCRHVHYSVCSSTQRPFPKR
jgi:hypothetical protein